MSVRDWVTNTANKYGINIYDYLSRSKILLMQQSVMIDTKELDAYDYGDDYKVPCEVHKLCFRRKFEYEVILKFYAGSGTPGCCQTFYLESTWTRKNNTQIDDDPEISLDNDYGDDSDGDGYL